MLSGLLAHKDITVLLNDQASRRAAYQAWSAKEKFHEQVRQVSGPGHRRDRPWRCACNGGEDLAKGSCCKGCESEEGEEGNHDNCARTQISSPRPGLMTRDPGPQPVPPVCQHDSRHAGGIAVSVADLWQ